MLKSNLAVLLAQRKMKISDLAKKTGISRTTLTNLYYEKSEGILFETLDKICKELNCNINELLIYEDETI